jgi:hypothetical protein
MNLLDLPGNGARPSLKLIAAKLFFVADAALKELGHQIDKQVAEC